ncbi:MAG: pseudouridine synthase, partial [Methanomicrobiales archaeon]|nr:pseudouridine synthase [Methanomicrobiales archaeon]
MSSVEVKRRDGLARSGICVIDGTSIVFPAAVDTAAIFHNLNRAALSNIPLSAGPEFVANYWPDCPVIPVMVHPHHTSGPGAGDCVMVPGWHTVLNNPRNYVTWLTALKAAVPPDTLWYAPAS